MSCITFNRIFLLLIITEKNLVRRRKYKDNGGVSKSIDTCVKKPVEILPSCPLEEWPTDWMLYEKMTQKPIFPGELLGIV
jgi:hypothetical protein